MAARRIAKELEKVRERFDAECVNDNIMRWHIALPGSDNSPYFGGTFLIEVVFTEDYPFRAPEVKFLTKIYHPNINHKGEVCLGVLKDDWKPSLSTSTIVDCISELLRTPNPNDPLVPEIAIQINRDPAAYKTKAEEYTHKYAM